MFTYKHLCSPRVFLRGSRQLAASEGEVQWGREPQARGLGLETELTGSLCNFSMRK